MTVHPSNSEDGDEEPSPNRGALESTFIGPISQKGEGSNSSEDGSSVGDSGPPLPGARATSTGDTEGPHIPDIDGYVIKRRLGDGGFGDVFEAKRVSLDLTVAIKLLNPKASRRDDVVQRFQREIKAYHNLTDANVVQYRTDGVCERGYYAGCPYIIMEYMDVGTLRDWLRKVDLNSGVGFRSAIRILSDVCRGLSFLHGRGVVHRDLKPENVLLSDLQTIPDKQEYEYGFLQTMEGQEGGSTEGAYAHPSRVKLTDFGLTTYRDGDSGGTTEGVTLGTFPYMPREQLEDSASVTAAADQYAVGVMLYEVLCGHRPWQTNGDEPEDRNLLASRTLSKTPVPSPTSDERRVDRRLRDICLRCLEAAAVDRYEHIDHVREELDAWLKNEPEVRPVRWTKRKTNAAIRAARRHPFSLLALITVATMLIFFANFFLHKQGHEWPSASYYNDVVERWGVFEGIQELSIEEVRKRPHSYRITRRGTKGKVINVDRVNGLLEPVEIPHEFVFSFNWGNKLKQEEPFDAFRHTEASYAYTYDTGGQLKQVSARSSLGTPLWNLNFTDRTTAQYDQLTPFNTLDTVSIVDAATGAPPCTGIKYEFTPSGLVASIRFLDRQGNPESLEGDVFEFENEHDDHGRIVRRIYKDKDGGATECGFCAAIDFAYGTRRLTITRRNEDNTPITILSKATCSIEFDHDERPSKVSFRNADGEIATGSRGECHLEYRYNVDGGLETVTYLNEHMKPHVTDRGFASVRFRYDSKGRQVSKRFFDDVGTAGVDESGWGVGIREFGHTSWHGWNREYDDKSGKMTEFEVGLDGEAIPAKKDGEFSKITKWRDEFGRTRAVAYFDHKSQPVENRQGIHRLNGLLNARGFVEEIEYLDKEGGRTLSPAGVSKMIRRQGPTGRVDWQAYFDELDQPIALSNGEYGRRIKNDSSGNATYIEFLGPDHKMQNTKEGYAYYLNLWDLGDRRWYDQNGLEVVAVLRVSQVLPKSNAEESGMKAGDEILRYSGQYAGNVQALQWLIRHQSDAKIELVIRRDDKKTSLTVEKGPLGVALQERYVPLDQLKSLGL